MSEWSSLSWSPSVLGRIFTLYQYIHTYCTPYTHHTYCRQRFAQLGSLYEYTLTLIYIKYNMYILYHYTQYITQDELYSFRPSVCLYICPSDSTTAARQLCWYSALLYNIWNTLSSGCADIILCRKSSNQRRTLDAHRFFEYFQPHVRGIHIRIFGIRRTAVIIFCPQNNYIIFHPI